MIAPHGDAASILHLGGKSLSLARPLIMGVVNITPDSFSDGGRFFDSDAALQHARRLLDEGADILDLGAESTRPGSARITAEEELRRLLPVLDPLLEKEGDRTVLSVDTSHPEVAEAALRRGVLLINDVRGLRNPDLRDVIGGFKAAALIMHMRGEPETMQDDPRYGDVVGEVKANLARQAERAAASGIREVIIDPGIGFGKTLEHNLALIRNLSDFRDLGRPVCLGVSRKAFIGEITGVPDALDRLEGTIVANAFGLWAGADILRVHDVQAAVRTVKMVEALRGPEGEISF
jgi:dihydropteroate synthase